nr:hypothetical protein [Tanacetum cinerariifolium]
MIVDSIENGPYVRRMIATPEEPDLPVPVPESFHEQTDEELTEIDIKLMDADDQAIQTILLGLHEDVYVVVDSCKTVKEIWERVRQMMKGPDIKEQKKKANLFNEWEKFTSTDGESIESYYLHFRKLMNHDEVNELRAERLAKSHDPLALMNSFNFPTIHKDQSSFSTHPQQSFSINNKYNPQPSLNQNFMQPQMTSLEDINDPTEAMNAALILFSKAFQLTAPTNNNERTSSNPRNLQIAQPEGYNAWQNGGIQVAQNACQNAGVQSGGNQNGLVVHASTSGTQLNKAPVYYTDGSAKVQLNDNCYDNEIFNMFTQEEQYTDLLEPIPEPQLVPQNDNHVTSVASKKKKLKHDFKTREDKFLDKDVDLEAKIKNIENILFKRDQTVQTMHMLNPKPDSFYHPNQKMALGYPNPSYLKKAQLKQQSLYNGNLLLEKDGPPAVYDSEETIELAQESREKMRFLKKEIKTANYAKINHLSGLFVPQTTKSKEELILSNVSNMVTVSKTISIPNEDLSDDTNPSVARKFLNKVKSSLVTLQCVVKQKMTLEVHNWSSSAHKEVHRIISHEIALIINQVDARVQYFEIQFLQEVAKFVRDFKSLTKKADESLDKQKSLELKIERLLKASVSHDIMSIVQNGFVDVPSDLRTDLDCTKKKLELCIIKKEKEYAILWNKWYIKCKECKYDKISYDKAYNDMQQKVERLQARLRDLNGKSSNTPSASNTIDPLNQKLESKIVKLEFQVLRAWVFENTSESMKNTPETSVTPHVDKPKLSAVTPHSKKLHASMPSHSVPQPREFNVVKHMNVISPGMFKINPSQTPKVDLVPNKQSSASIRTNPITNSQRHVFVKENVCSNTVTASSTRLVHTARTRRPQPKGNTRNVKVP